MTEDGKIHGYKPMNDAQREAVETIKRHEENLAALIAGIRISDDPHLVPKGFYPDHGLLCDAQRQFMMGYMLLIRAVARPVDPYEIAIMRAEDTGE